MNLFLVTTMKSNNFSSENDAPLDNQVKQQPRRKLFFWLLPATFGSCLLFVAILLALKGRETPLKSTPLVKPPTQQVASKDMATLVQGNTKFAIDLYKQLGSQKPATENVFFSPYSISSALAMTSAGARGKTATQMNQVLSFSLPPTTLHPGFAQLNYQLTNTQEYQLSIANRLWAQNNFSLLPPFGKITEDFYGAKIESLNFAKAEEATAKINNWVSQRTQNQINHLLNDCDVGKNTKLVLTNAIYFKGDWQDKFESKDTKNEPFTLASGKKEQVPLMYQSNHFGYAESSNLQVLQMPYKGDKLSMVILLPAKPDGLPNLERNLTTANLEKWLSFSQPEVAVWLPKLKFEQRFKLKDPLSKMGMADAFNEAGKADFSGITNQTNLHIGDVIHKAFVEVDESGSKAAAATAVTMCDEGRCYAEKSVRPMPKLFRADRPFLFLIKDQESGSILFMGRFVNPKPNSIKEEGLCLSNRN